MPTDDELERRLFGVESNVVGLLKVVRELAARQALLALALREPGAVDEAELDETLEALNEIDTLLTRISEFLPDVGD